MQRATRVATGNRVWLRWSLEHFGSDRPGGATGWSRRAKLPPEVNVNGTEIGAVFSPSGKSLLFARDTKGPDSGEFFLLRVGGDEAWPPECAGNRK